LTPIRGRRDTVRAPVLSVVEGFLGLAAYADLQYLSRLVGEERADNGLQLAVDPAQRGELFQAIKQLPNAQGLSVRADTQASIESTFIQSMNVSLGIAILFAGVIAFGSVLNFSMIEIGDRLRDIATFRVIGYRPRAIAGIFFRENLVIFLLGLAFAYPLGYALVHAIAGAYDSELFRMPVVLHYKTAVWTALIAFVFVVAAQIVVHRQIHKLDWRSGILVKE
jgi:putative ABC transport system permease protein